MNSRGRTPTEQHVDDLMDVAREAVRLFQRAMHRLGHDDEADHAEGCRGCEAERGAEAYIIATANYANSRIATESPLPDVQDYTPDGLPMYPEKCEVCGAYVPCRRDHGDTESPLTEDENDT